jgi:hypothetical protein
MNKFKLGQRVKIIRTGKIGKIAELDNEDFDKEGRSNNCYGVRYKGWRYSYWFTVHDLEEVKDILDSKEREYLSNVIKPFRDRAINIKKFENYREKEYITIYIKNDFEINLPNFEKNTMYKNMEIDKAYTLEELGL